MAHLDTKLGRVPYAHADRAYPTMDIYNIGLIQASTFSVVRKKERVCP